MALKAQASHTVGFKITTIPQYGILFTGIPHKKLSSSTTPQTPMSPSVWDWTRTIPNQTRTDRLLFTWTRLAPFQKGQARTVPCQPKVHPVQFSGRSIWIHLELVLCKDSLSSCGHASAINNHTSSSYTTVIYYTMGLRLFWWAYFRGSLFLEGLIIGGNFVFQNGLVLTIKTANSNSPWAYIREGLLLEGYLRWRSGGLIFGRAYFWEGLLSEFYGSSFQEFIK